jgi:hypothetical protein
MVETDAGEKFLTEVVGLIRDEWGAEEADAARIDYEVYVSDIETEAIAGERARIRAAIDALCETKAMEPSEWLTSESVYAAIDPEPEIALVPTQDGVVSFADAVKRLAPKAR